VNAPTDTRAPATELEKTAIELCFPSPVICHTWADTAALNDALRQRILEAERSAAGRSKSNIGGWHSETGSLEWLGEPGKALMDRIVALANHATNQLLAAYGQQKISFDWTFQAWANVSRTADFNRAHTHPGSTWSGTYYVDAGHSQPGGANTTPLELLDPCPGRANTFFTGLVRSSVIVHPIAGMMILFPSYVSHMVFAHRGDRPRISIAFNLRKEPFP
jgi:uncharacterized protein (TIGR02466 family)